MDPGPSPGLPSLEGYDFGVGLRAGDAYPGLGVAWVGKMKDHVLGSFRASVSGFGVGSLGLRN